MKREQTKKKKKKKKSSSKSIGRRTKGANRSATGGCDRALCRGV